MSSQGMINQGLFEEQEMGNTQMGFFPFPQNLTFPSLLGNCNHQSLKAAFTNISASLAAAADVPETLLSAATIIKQREDNNNNTSDLGGGGGGGPQLLSLQGSSANLWAWGEVNTECLSKKRSSMVDHDHIGIGVSAMKMKKIKARRKVREPRFCFKTMSDVDVLDDGYKWRKYGQKVVKNTNYPRSYYRCTQDSCRVKKRVERLAEDPRMVITTYEGRHAHSPSLDQDDSSQPPNSLLNNFFW